MARNPAARRNPVERVAAGTVYLVLSLVLFLAWLWVDVALLALLAVPTLVAGLVALAVGWPQVRRDLMAERGRRAHGRSHDVPSPPRPRAS